MCMGKWETIRKSCALHNGLGKKVRKKIDIWIDKEINRWVNVKLVYRLPPP